MKKWLIFFFTFAIIVVVAFSSYIYLYRAEFASHTLSQLFGTPAKVGDIRLTRNGLLFENVAIYNPQNSKLESAFSAKAVQVKIGSEGLLKAIFGFGVAEIDKVYIYKPLFGIELYDASGSKSNWRTLLENGTLNFKEGQKVRRFHLKNVTLEKVAIELLNSAVSPSVQHPHSIDKIQLGQVKDSPPTSIYRMIHATAKVSIFQIASTLKENDFSKSINDVPLLPAPSDIELIALKKKEAKTEK